ncbi:MAG: DUF5060 domain-containing protein [Verrucomicrobia bacterium]|nr:DUF5060 domain-containing protein [Verrucomicrobiota bacterium]
MAEERGGLVTVEAEHFYKQTLTKKRRWHLTTVQQKPTLKDDPDNPHLANASGGAYLECLPDTRQNHSNKLVHGENFSNLPGKLAVLHYKLKFNTPGKYYVWVRAYSTGTEDNGLHVGLNGTWPESGQRMQWCKGKNTWRWESKQRTQKIHCGAPFKIFLNIPNAGTHEIQFSMREDGFEFDQFRLTTNRNYKPDQVNSAVAKKQVKRDPHGKGQATLSGELNQWHKVTLNLDGPFAHEMDTAPNPFTDYRMDVTFTHESGKPNYVIPGYFAADGNAANTSASKGTIWRAHLTPDKPGRWSYRVAFFTGNQCAIGNGGKRLMPYDDCSGEFEVAATDKVKPDFRGHGRLQYVGSRYLRFAGSGEYFLKAGADAPETFLAYKDFDGTVARKPKVPLKTWQPHVRDWRDGDPVWDNGKGKGMIGALNYLSKKGCNVFSFLTYNAGGDGDNVWPFIQRDAKLHYDCSKLDQWGIVFDHAAVQGLYLHFKLQETEMDDNRHGKNKEGNVPTALDGGKLGLERKLYLRELVARFSHALALNWNLGEENTQSTVEQRAMAKYIRDLDPYDHHIVVHTFPNQQDNVYRPLLGQGSVLTGFSLQNSNIKDTHWQVVKWCKESASTGKPWVVAFDESGTAQYAQVPDLGYRGFNGRDAEGKKVHTQHEVRKYTLWGTLMGGGMGCEYYFGYKLAENDLVCEDWRSRDQSWDYCRIAIDFFQKNRIPFWEMENANSLVENWNNKNDKYCFAKKGEIYVIYLPNGGSTQIDLSGVDGTFSVSWFNPRKGGKYKNAATKQISGGEKVLVGNPPSDIKEDWAVVIIKQTP